MDPREVIKNHLIDKKISIFDIGPFNDNSVDYPDYAKKLARRIKLKKSDLMYEVGFGIDFYLEYFKFAPEFKATFGLVDMLVNDDSIYSSSIKKMLTHGFTFTLTFE